ncbi:hypothetical protein FB451DRAFT_1410221 [Mycena latifolia]|nr:hypothetical protein FB451DRAFT_1410221 [Mycena latifolia]
MQCAAGRACGILAYAGAKPESVRVLTVHGWDDYASIVASYVWLAGDALANILVAVTLLALSAQSTTRDLVKNIVRLVIKTNTISALIAIVGIALLVGRPVRNIPHSTQLRTRLSPQGTIYTNTFLTILNNRAITRLIDPSSFEVEDRRPSDTSSTMQIIRRATMDRTQ